MSHDWHAIKPCALRAKMAGRVSPPGSQSASLPESCVQPEPCSEENLDICILDVGEKFTYRVPSFPVLSCRIRRMKFKLETDSAVYDGFIKDCPSLERVFPALIVAGKGYEDCFFVPKHDFSQTINVHGLVLYDDSIFILWKWKWAELYTPDQPLEIGSGYDDLTSPNSTSESEDENITHTIVFKCIGSNKDLKSQDILRAVSQKLEAGIVVRVKVEPEPMNPKDERALAFVCEVDGKWHRIGYVVRECRDAVHDALSNGPVPAEFGWVKYIVHWSKSGPGWYAGVKLTKKGYWPSSVVKSQSTIK